MTNTTQTDLLDGVEPDAWISEVRCIGPEYGKKRYARLPIQSLQPLYYQHTRLYSRETVEALLEANRKQVLQEAAEWFDSTERYKFWPKQNISAALRRMALEPTGVDKGEKSE
jgi:hypothetical protein